MAENSNATSPKADRGRNWCDEEVRALISVWSDSVSQGELEGTHRNQHMYKKMSAELEKRGYHRSWEKCRDQVKKLKQKYKKVVVCASILYDDNSVAS